MVSVVAPVYTGGLAAYQRALARALRSAQSGIEGRFIAVLLDHPTLPRSTEEPGWPIYPAGNPWLWRQVWRPLMTRCAPRARLHKAIRWLSYQAISRKWREQGAGIIHYVGTGWDLAGFGWCEVAARRNSRFTVLPAVHPRSWGDDGLDVSLYRCASTVLCLSGEEVSHLHLRGVPRARMRQCVLPPMCRPDGNGARFRARHGLDGKKCVLFMGRRDAGKGYPALLELWTELARKFPEAVLVLGGSGGADFRQMLQAIPRDCVCDLGVPDDIAKADALAGCDMMCFPSAHESFGLVIVEAWSYGMPVICGTSAACRELVRDGVTGLWSSQNRDELATAVGRYLASPNWAKECGERGRIIQRQHYTEKHMLDTHLAMWGYF